jgi:hypothetical protein
MVRTIDAGLSAAISATTQQPVMRCTIAITDPQFATYQSAAGTECRSAACVAGDGSIVRAHLPQSGGASQPLSVQRITDPSQASQWTTWTQLATGMNVTAGCAMAYMDNAVFLFAQQYGGSYPMVFWTSADNGQTWSAMRIMPALPTSPTNVRGIASAGNNDCFIQYDVSGGEQIAYASYSGSWGIWLQSTLGPMAAGAGIAVTYVGGSTNTYYIATSDGQILNAYRYAPGSGTWSQPPVIVPASASGVAHVYPFLTQLQSGIFTLCYNEIDTGTVTSLVYSRPRLITSRDFTHWSDGYPLGISCSLGATLLDATTSPPAGSAGPGIYVAGDLQIWRSPQYSQSNIYQYQDVSSRIISFDRREKVNAKGELQLVLDNADGALTPFVTGGPISPNAVLTLSEGYQVNGAPDTVTTGIYRIERVTLARSPDASQIHILGYDPTKWLKWQVRTMRSYTNQTLGWLIAEIVARANIPLAPLPNTPQVGEILPSFIVPTGSTLAHAFKELVSTYDLYWLYDQQNGLTLRELNSGDGVNWAYSPDWFALTLGWAGDDDRATHIIITGKPLSTSQLCAAEAVDYANSARVNQDRVLHVANPRLTTNVAAAVKASLLLADEQRANSTYAATVAGNPALQVLDVVKITDAFLDLSNTVRITELHVTYKAEQATYLLTFTAEAV